MTNANNNSMANVLNADFYKVSKLKSIYIGAAIMFVLMLINFAVYWYTLSVANSILDEFEREGMLALIGAGKDRLFQSSALIDIGLFIAIILGIFIGGEFSNGTIKTAVARGGNRVQIYFSKWLTMATLVVAYSLYALIIAGILTAIKGYGEDFTALQFGLLVRSTVLQMLVNLSIGSLFVMIGFLCRSAGSSIGVSLAAYILISVIITVISVIVSVSGGDAKWLTELISFLPAQQLSSACNSGTYEIGELMKVIFVPIGYIGLSSLIGCLSFIKRDIK